MRQLARRSALRVVNVGFHSTRVPTGRVDRWGLVMLAVLAGAASCNTPSAPVEAGAVVRVEPPVPAPEGLLLAAWVRGPDAAWGEVQRGVGGVAALLPVTVGELVCAFAGLDPRLAPLVDGNGTSYVVLGHGGAESGPSDGALAPRWVMALPLTDAGLASSMLLGAGDAGAAAGATAPYVAHDVEGMRVLSGHAAPLHVIAALAAGAHGWLLLASSEEDLARLGPYAVRTMPSRAAPVEAGAIVADVPQSAMAGALGPWLAARWGEIRAWLGAKDEEQRAKHGGRAPDFGDPQPIVEALDGAVRERVALVAQARGARVIVDPGDDEVHAELTLDPGGDAESARQLASMVPGDARPLAASPADTLVAVMVRDDPKARDEDATTIQGTLDRALGDRLHEEDARAVHAAITDWQHARGDWWTAAVTWGTSDASRGLWVVTPATSAGASSRAIREVVDLSHRRVFQALLASSLHLSPAAVTPLQAPPLGKASLATFAADRTGDRTSIPGAAPGIAWGVTQDPAPGELLVAAGPSARQLLAREIAPGGRLGDDSRTARALAALGEAVTFALVAQPLRLDPARAGLSSGASAPVVLGWGRKGAEAWARVEVADTVLGELLPLGGGDP
jgi:hypothetical protein